MPNIDMPFYSQETDGARRYYNDCGPAHVRSFYGKHLIDNGYPDPRESITVDTFAGNAMKNKDRTLLTRDLVDLGLVWGVTLVSTDGPQLRPARIKQEIDEGNPMIAVCIYTWLPIHFVDDPTDFGHYIALTGYEADEQDRITHYYYNDPLAKTEAQGKGILAPAEMIEKALNPGPNRYFSVPFQGAFYRPTKIG